VISTALRVLALTACGLVLLSFAFFVVDQAGAASDQSVKSITNDQGQKRDVTSTNVPNPDPATEKRREQENGSFREYVDDADDILVSPFTGIVDSKNIWVMRGLPTLFALLVYGGIGLMVARAAFMRRL
jgi:hypothetical protein